MSPDAYALNEEAKKLLTKIEDWKTVATELEHALRICFPYDDERTAIRAKALTAFEEISKI